MSRDVNGNYTVPNGTTAVGGTTISSSAYNAVLADLQAALTDSLSRTGKGGMLAALTFADGTVASPTVAFADEPTTGIYRAAAGQINVTVGGVKILTISGTGIYSEFPHYQLVGLAYAKLTDVADDFDIAGAWDFITTVPRILGGPALFHSSDSLSSGSVTVEQGAGPPVGGNDGDFVFYYT